MAFKKNLVKLGHFNVATLVHFLPRQTKMLLNRKLAKKKKTSLVVFFLMEESKYYFAEMIFFSFNFSFYLYNSQKSCKDQSCPYVGLIEVFNFCFYNFFFCNSHTKWRRKPFGQKKLSSFPKNIKGRALFCVVTLSLSFTHIHSHSGLNPKRNGPFCPCPSKNNHHSWENREIEGRLVICPSVTTFEKWTTSIIIATANWKKKKMFQIERHLMLKAYKWP